MNPTMQLGEK